MAIDYDSDLSLKYQDCSEGPVSMEKDREDDVDIFKNHDS